MITYHGYDSGITILCIMLDVRDPRQNAATTDSHGPAAFQTPRTHRHRRTRPLNVFPLNRFSKALLTEQKQACPWIPLENINKPLSKLIHKMCQAPGKDLVLVKRKNE